MVMRQFLVLTTLFSLVISQNYKFNASQNKIEDIFNRNNVDLNQILEYLAHPQEDLERLLINSRERNSGETYGMSIAYSSDLITMRTAIDELPDSLCKNQSLEFLAGLVLNEKWALKMYDASAKSPTGLLFGSNYQLGNFDECISVGNDNKNGTISRIQGQYCLAKITLEKSQSVSEELKSFSKRTGLREDINWAICTPSSCSSETVKQFIKNLFKSTRNNANVYLSETLCHTDKPIKIDNKDITFVSIISFVSFIMLMATVYHGYLYYCIQKHQIKKSGYVVDAILSFSLARNLNKIFSIKEGNEMGLEAIAGIRTISMIIVFACHSLMFIVSGPVMNSGVYDEMITQVQNAFLLNNPLFVDTFFVIGAFLFARILLSELDKRKGNINVIPIYVFRYIRVTPSYLVVIAFYCTWLDKISNGPLWDYKMQIEKERCLESWWTNILYINNYVNTDKMCMFQSWYLSVDTQLFFLAPLIIYPLWKWRQIGEWIIIVVTLITGVIPFYITYVNQLDPTLMGYAKEIYDIIKNYYFKEAYIKTHMRANAYCIGLLTGYILYRIQNSSYKISKSIVRICWTVGTICGLSSVFTIALFYQEDYEYSPLIAALYSSLHRLAWGFSTGWVLIACATKNGGFIEKILSWKVLVPLSRLTFCAYLVNGIVELHGVGITRNPVHLSIFNLLMLTLLYTFQTFVCALVLCLMFESPIHGIEKILLEAFGVKSKRKINTSPKDVEPVLDANQNT